MNKTIKKLIKYSHLLFCSDPPQVSAVANVVITNLTNTTSLSCQVFGIPAPTIDWLRTDSMLLSNTSDISISQVATNNGSNVTSTLLFTRPVRADEGTYVCRGTNNVTNLINSPENDTVTFYVQCEYKARLL